MTPEITPVSTSYIKTNSANHKDPKLLLFFGTLRARYSPPLLLSDNTQTCEPHSYSSLPEISLDLLFICIVTPHHSLWTVFFCEGPSPAGRFVQVAPKQTLYMLLSLRVIRLFWISSQLHSHLLQWVCGMEEGLIVHSLSS